MGNRHTNFNPICIEKDWELKMRPMIANVAIEEGSAVYRVGDGTHTVVTNATSNFEGITAEPIVATDADYATSMKMKAVWVPRNASAEAEFAVGAGTFTTADIGKSVVFNDAKGLAVDSAGTQAVILGLISSTKGICKFNQVIA